MVIPIRKHIDGNERYFDGDASRKPAMKDENEEKGTNALMPSHSTFTSNRVQEGNVSFSIHIAVDGKIEDIIPHWKHRIQHVEWGGELKKRRRSVYIPFFDEGLPGVSISPAKLGIDINTIVNDKIAKINFFISLFSLIIVFSFPLLEDLCPHGHSLRLDTHLSLQSFKNPYAKVHHKQECLQVQSPKGVESLCLQPVDLP